MREARSRSSPKNLLAFCNLCLYNRIFLARQSADDAHFARENIEKLRQFVYPHFSHPPPASEYVLLRIFKHMRRHIMRSRHFHASEFEQTELRFMYTDSLCLKNTGPGSSAFMINAKTIIGKAKTTIQMKDNTISINRLKNAYTFSLKPTFKKSFSMRNIRKAPRKRQAELAEHSCRHCKIINKVRHCPRVQKAKNILHSRSQFVAQGRFAPVVITYFIIS